MSKIVKVPKDIHEELFNRFLLGESISKLTKEFNVNTWYFYTIFTVIAKQKNKLIEYKQRVSSGKIYKYKNGKLVAKFNSYKEAANNMDCSISPIYKAVKENKSYKGFTWTKEYSE